MSKNYFCNGINSTCAFRLLFFHIEWKYLKKKLIKQNVVDGFENDTTSVYDAKRTKRMKRTYTTYTLLLSSL